METTLLIITSLTLASSIVGPLILAGAAFINRIRKSDCCGGHIELDAAQKSPKIPNEMSTIDKPEITNELQPKESTLNKLMNLLKQNK